MVVTIYLGNEWNDFRLSLVGDGRQGNYWLSKTVVSYSGTPNEIYLTSESAQLKYRN